MSVSPEQHAHHTVQSLFKQAKSLLSTTSWRSLWSPSSLSSVRFGGVFKKLLKKSCDLPSVQEHAMRGILPFGEPLRKPSTTRRTAVTGTASTPCIALGSAAPAYTCGGEVGCRGRWSPEVASSCHRKRSCLWSSRAHKQTSTALNLQKAERELTSAFR